MKGIKDVKRCIARNCCKIAVLMEVERSSYKRRIILRIKSFLVSMREWQEINLFLVCYTVVHIPM